MLTKSRRLHLFTFSLMIALLTTGATFCFAAPSADELLKRKGFAWKSAVTEHLRLHFEPNSFAETRIEDLKRWQEKSFRTNLQLLKISGYLYQTDIFIVASRGRMKQLIGEETNGVAYPDKKIVCLIFNEKLNGSSSHELMHVMAGNVWGLKFKPWINEGFAIYSDDNWHGYRLHDLNKYFLLNKKLIPIEKLVADFKSGADTISYPQAGSFVKYLYEEYGVEKVKDLWKSGRVRDFKQVLGKDIFILEKEWHGKLLEADATKIKYNF